MNSTNFGKHDIVVIGASAGGVEALSKFLRYIPARIEASLFVVLHIPAHTPTQLDAILRQTSALDVLIAEDGQKFKPGTVYVAPTNRHLMLENGTIRTTRGPKEGRVRPSIDVLFRSASVAYGPRVIGVVLSGTLDDGTAGLWAIKDKRGAALVQTPSEAMFSSMPESAIEHVEVDVIAPLESLARAMQQLISTSCLSSSPASAPDSGGLAQGDAAEAAYASGHGHEVENKISLEGNGLQLGVMNLGTASKYICPDCHGVLIQIVEGRIVRFRCHTGHAFSLQTLLAEVNESIDKGLWDSMRAIEERIMLLRQLQRLEKETGHDETAAQYQQKADTTERQLQPLRELVVDTKLLD